MIKACKPIMMDPVTLENKVVGRIEEGEAYLGRTKAKIEQLEKNLAKIQSNTAELAAELKLLHNPEKSTKDKPREATFLEKAQRNLLEARSEISGSLSIELRENRKPYIEQVAKEFDEKLKSTKPIDAEEGGPEHIRQVLQELPNIPKAVWQALGVHFDTEGFKFGKSLSDKGQEAINLLFNKKV